MENGQISRYCSKMQLIKNLPYENMTGLSIIMMTEWDIQS